MFQNLQKYSERVECTVSDQETTRKPLDSARKSLQMEKLKRGQEESASGSGTFYIIYNGTGIGPGLSGSLHKLSFPQGQEGLQQLQEESVLPGAFFIPCKCIFKEQKRKSVA